MIIPVANFNTHTKRCNRFAVKIYLKCQTIPQAPKLYSSKDLWTSQQLVLFKLSLSQIPTASSNEPDSAVVKYPLSLAQRLAFTCCDLLNWVKRTVRGCRYSEVLSESHFLCSWSTWQYNVDKSVTLRTSQASLSLAFLCVVNMNERKMNRSVFSVCLDCVELLKLVAWNPEKVYINILFFF